MQISQPYADYLNAENDILSSIAKNESEIALLRKKYKSEKDDASRIADIRQIS